MVVSTAKIIYGFANQASPHAASEYFALKILKMPSKDKTKSRFVPR